MGPDGLKIILQQIAKPEMFVPEKKIAGVDAAIREDGEFGGSSRAPDRIEAGILHQAEIPGNTRLQDSGRLEFDPVQVIIKH
jgi:hypothetical protein